MSENGLIPKGFRHNIKIGDKVRLDKLPDEWEVTELPSAIHPAAVKLKRSGRNGEGFASVSRMVDVHRLRLVSDE